jgi:hypothetical protein
VDEQQAPEYHLGVEHENKRVVSFMKNLAKDLREFDEEKDAVFVEEIIKGINND